MAERSANDVTAARPNPNSKWVCGYQHIGLACAEGPNEKGVCCQLKKTDRNGVPRKSICHEDCSCSQTCELTKLKRTPQLPSHESLKACTPLRAPWFSRRVLTVNLAILTAGALLLCMALPQREAIFVPGGLSQKHSQILGNHLVSERCGLCHPNSHADATTVALQDQLCMKCHATHLPDALLRTPHDLTATQLVSLTSGEGASAEPGQTAGKATRCAQCHVEHHGEGFQLTAISDSSCQACHQQKFASLAAGHPQFEGYPYRTQRRLAFDHSSHESKHFGTKNEKFECSRCHVDNQQTGAVGSVFRSLSFERACASCHNESIKAATINGWALLQLPSVDPQDVSSERSRLKDWPTTAQFGREGVISAPMRLLLAADAETQAALALLPPSGKIQDIDSSQQQRGAAAQALALGVRRLIAEVAMDGQAAWKRRLSTVAQLRLQREPTDHELALIGQMSNGLPPDLFRHMEAQWFGNQAVIASKSQPPMRLASQLQGQSLLLEDDSSGSNSDLLVDDADALLGGSLGSPAASSDDLLLGGGAETSLSPDGLLGASGDGRAGGTLPSANKGKLTSIKGATHVAAGGWYVDQQLLALRYMPQGHADPTLAAWAEFINILDADRSQGTHAIAAVTQGEAVPGACTQCHILSPVTAKVGDASSWKGSQRPSSARLFTKFDHTPHLTLPELSDCRHCHTRNGERTNMLGEVFARQMKAPSDRQSELKEIRQCLAGEFGTMQLEQCSACHRPGAASDRCTQCHNYHVGSQGFEWSN